MNEEKETIEDSKNILIEWFVIHTYFIFMMLWGCIALGYNANEANNLPLFVLSVVCFVFFLCTLIRKTVKFVKAIAQFRKTQGKSK